MQDQNGWEPEQLEKMREDLLSECHKKAESIIAGKISGGYGFTHSGQEYVFDTSADSLSKLAIAYNTAKAYLANGLNYSQPMVMKDYRVVIMDRDSIISNYEAMVTYGLRVYGDHAALVQALNGMTYYELLEWHNSN